MTSFSEMARCLQASRLLQRYLDGETDAATAGRITEHLERCRRCTRQARTYEAIKRSLRSTAPGTDDPAVHRLRAFQRTLAHQDDGGSPTDR